MYKRSRVYDCFTFFNELDLLEIRLRELEEVIDFFVIAEADKAHSGQKKKYILEKNMQRFSRWKNKIIYIKVRMPEFTFLDRIVMGIQSVTHNQFLGSNLRLGRWKLENFQRGELSRGLTKCNDEDIIIVSDLDEIPSKQSILKIREELETHEKVGFEQKMFNHYLNGSTGKLWNRARALKYKTLKNKFKNNPQLVRLKPFHFQLKRIGLGEKIFTIQNAGWHFNNVGRKHEVISRILAKSDADVFRGKNFSEKLERYKKRGKFLGPSESSIQIIKIDKTFPREIYKNQDRYSHLIRVI